MLYAFIISFLVFLFFYSSQSNFFSAVYYYPYNAEQYNVRPEGSVKSFFSHLCIFFFFCCSDPQRARYAVCLYLVFNAKCSLQCRDGYCCLGYPFQFRLQLLKNYIKMVIQLLGNDVKLPYSFQNMKNCPKYCCLSFKRASLFILVPTRQEIELVCVCPISEAEQCWRD